MDSVQGTVPIAGIVTGEVTVAKSVPIYRGEYTVDPSAEGPVVLETADTHLLENITVRQVVETISATDDGEGNITLTGNITVIDDGGGNITL